MSIESVNSCEHVSSPPQQGRGRVALVISAFAQQPDQMAHEARAEVASQMPGAGLNSVPRCEAERGDCYIPKIVFEDVFETGSSAIY
jgi:hypothetical protein